MNPHARTLTDAIMMVMLLVFAAMLVHQQLQLTKSRDRENEMFVLANRLDNALVAQEMLTLHWRSGALACLGPSGPLLSPTPFSAFKAIK